MVFAGVSMESWGVSLVWEVCLGRLGVRENYIWCLVIILFMRLGGAKRWGVRGFKVII